MMMNGVRFKFDLPPVAWLDETTAVTGPTPGGQSATLSTPPEASQVVKVALGSVVDQGMGQEVPMLSAGELAVRRKR